MPNTQFTDEELITELRSSSRWNKARQIFSGQSARIEQAHHQRIPLDPITMRKMEFEAVRRILEVYGVNVTRGD